VDDSIRIVNTRSVSAPRPSLLPLLRSENQLRLLAKLLLEPERWFTMSELTAETGVPQPSVSREVGNLTRVGLLSEDLRHRRRVVRADAASPIYPELASLLRKTAGPKPVLERVLAGLPHVDRALVYGSWAARYHGVDGPPPGDIDLLVVGTPDVREVRRRADLASAELGRDVNATVLTPKEWAKRSGFIGHVRRSPVVDLDLAG
jgi:DNA-binding transcriptional ArsR family regulator